MNKSWGDRTDHMRLHGNLAKVHLTEILYSFGTDDEEWKIYEHFEEIIAPLMEWIDNEAPWL